MRFNVRLLTLRYSVKAGDLMLSHILIVMRSWLTLPDNENLRRRCYLLLFVYDAVVDAGEASVR